MDQSWVMLDRVSFAYETASRPLLEDLSAHFPTGWTGIIGANGVGKTTILRLATGELTPQAGRVRTPGRAIYCPQRTDTPPNHLEEMLQAADARVCELKGRLGVDEDWPMRWDTLSHGERKRAQIAVVLWLRPEVLAIDEPTNHIDAEARALLASALRTFEGVGLLVSHDRELLDTLCRQCLFVDPPHAVMRPGGYAEGAQQAQREAAQHRRDRKIASAAYVRLQREAVKRREEASRADRKRSKRGLAPRDHDARAKIDLARVTGKDARAGQLLNQIRGRLSQAEQRLERIKVKKVYQLGIWVPGSRSHRDYLFRLPAGTVSLGVLRRLRFPETMMRPEDRIALTGPNGTGKTTLIRHILSRVDVPREKVTYVPQEIDLESSIETMARVRGLRDETLGRVMALVSRLNSRPARLLESNEPSPGEIRKVLLALGIAREPHLIIMDEPTNHLDLPSIECLEQALEGCPCALLLVSHDLRFLNRLTETRWRIVPAVDGSQLLVEQ